MNLTLQIWRQNKPDINNNGNYKPGDGKMTEYKVSDISPDMSFLEMLDELNEDLLKNGEDPVAFDHDCREGICGMCSLYINGQQAGKSPGDIDNWRRLKKVDVSRLLKPGDNLVADTVFKAIQAGAKP